MRAIRFALLSSAVVLAACGGKKEDAAPAAEAAPAAAAAAAPAPAGAAAVTGTTHEVQMTGDATGYKFSQAAITVKAGDAIKFTFVSGGPHNVAIDPAGVPADVKSVLDANFGADKMGELSSKMLLNAGESVTISFAGIKPGVYEFHCTPHLAMNMKIKVTVQ